MNGWDLAIYIVFALWVAAFAAVVAVGLKIKNGLVAKTIADGKSFANTVRTLVDSGKRVASTNKIPITLLVAHVREINSSIRLEEGHAVFANEPINYAKLAGYLTTIRAVRGGLANLNQFRNRKAIATAIAAKPPKPTFAEKLGLIPPAARHVAPVIRYAKIALQTHRELRKRGIY